MSSKTICFDFNKKQTFFQTFGDPRTCIAALKACCRVKNLHKGKQLHSWMLVNGFLSSPFCATSLITMYSRCRQMTHAVSVFHSSPIHEPSVWNAIISAFISNARIQDALMFYIRMRQMSITPDKFTFSRIITSFCDILGVKGIKNIHAEVFKFGLEFEPFIGSALVSNYFKFGLIDHAHGMFDDSPMPKEVTLYNSMIHGFANLGEFSAALKVFREMAEDSVAPNSFTVTGIVSILSMNGDLINGTIFHGFVVKLGYDFSVEVSTSLIALYGKGKTLLESLKIFDSMVERDILSWNSIMCVHQHHGDHSGTLKLFAGMLKSRVPSTEVTIAIVLPACAVLVDLPRGREIHGHMIVAGLGTESSKNDECSIKANNSLMSMYTKCGSLKDACAVFDRTNIKNLSSWNIMIWGFGIHGNAVKALDVFSEMCSKCVKPDEITFAGLLSACSRAGLVDHGREILEQMEPKYGVLPTEFHFTCVVDMMGRAGKLDEAFELVSTMSLANQNQIVWRALLSACEIHGNASLAKVAVRRALELDPGVHGNYVLMSKVYGQIGEYENASGMRCFLNERRVRMITGGSWIAR